MSKASSTITITMHMTLSLTVLAQGSCSRQLLLPRHHFRDHHHSNSTITQINIAGITTHAGSAPYPGTRTSYCMLRPVGLPAPCICTTTCLLMITNSPSGPSHEDSMEE
mmetsp:Transcript_32001/g.71108  ORF Transcript_32001/g.71108 Transcript_32001/m.71108 type:complete len:109 (-) Transcript_32001:76-402(-)